MDTSKTKGKILIVEDDIDIREAMSEILKSEGHPTAEAFNGAEALKYLRNNPQPCLVILDMMMPIMNGRQFLDIFRLEPKNDSTPVVIISAIADRIDTTGANEFIRKPLDLSNLITVVQKYC